MSDVSDPSDVVLAAFRYEPAIGGAERYARRLLHEIGPALRIEVQAWLTSQRTDWLAALAHGERAAASTYVVDGRRVLALGPWPSGVARRIAALAPFYHLPGGPVPGIMGRLLAPHLAPAVGATRLVHSVFMGREAYPLAYMLAAHERKLPFVFTPLRHQRPFGWNSPAFRRLYREADAIVALTEDEKRWVVRHGADPKRVHVHGIGPLNDPTASTAAAREALGDEAPFVLFLGQLHAYKGFAALLDAARVLHPRHGTRFVFAGPDVRGNASQFSSAGPGITYLGRVSDELRESLLSACAVLCVPSSRESFGAVLVEAWNCGKPVVAGPAPAAKELVQDGVDGYNVEQTGAALVRALEPLLLDEALRTGMGAAGREKVRQRYSWSVISEAHREIYSLLGVEPST
ncbi:MAG: glycosyltransferase family 4 protein [Candidatus Dormibacteria bacterium]